MQRKGLEPKVITYNAFISACAKGDNAVKALQPWVEMLRKGLEPDVITYIAPICACAKGDYAEKTWQLAEE
jgi:pentatricopeptide repeat protein